MNMVEWDGLAEALFREASDAMLLCDPETDRILEVNAVVARLTGFTHEQISAMEATYLFRYSGQGGKQKLRQAANRSEEFHAQEGFLLRTTEDGLWIPVNVSVTRLHVKPKTLALITLRDVREQRETLARLQRMEAQLRQVLASVSDCLWSASIKRNGSWQYRYFSPVIERITNRPEEFFQPGLARWASIVHPEDRPLWQRFVGKLRSGQSGEESYRVVWPDHTIRWLSERVQVSTEGEGDLRLDGIVTDRTERRLAEEALARSEVQMRSVWERSLNGMRLTDEQGIVRRVNEAYCRMVGMARDGLEAEHFSVIYAPEHRGHIAQVYVDHFRARSISPSTQTEVTLWTGRSIWLEISSSFIETPGQPTLLLSIFHNITERKLAENVLAQERNLLRTLIDNLPGHIFIKDEHSRFLVVNRATLQTLGNLTTEQVLGKTDFELLPQELATAYFRDEQAVLASGESMLNREEKMITSSGRERWLLTTKVPLRDPQGHITGLVGISHDITQRKQVEEQLNLAMAATKQASRAKSEFLARMSHEIRTPMNGVIGMTHLALETHLTKEQREYLDLVRLSAENLLTVIDDILDFSKIEAGKLKLYPIPFALRDTLADTLRTFSVRADEKQLELTYRVAPDVPDSLVGDVVRLRQVLVNLVGNALKFTEQGEIVLNVCLERKQSPTAELEMCLRFSVRDTGVGISKEKQKLIFEPFEQVDTSDKRRHGGTGLGLTIAKQLVHLMQGDLWVDSDPGKGSMFHFTTKLSLQPRQEELDSALALDDLDPVNLPVLIVDDNATQRRILTELLTHWHYKPFAVAGPLEALETLRQSSRSGQEPYRLLLLDRRLQQSDGFEIAEQIRTQLELPLGIILLLPAGERPEDVDRSQALNIQARLRKPIKQSELRAALRQVYRQETASQRGDSSLQTRSSPAPKPVRPLRILLAEDNLVNQKLALHLLEKQGHSVLVANNGKEVLQAWRRFPLDLILMDLQMPEMSGLEATQQIRRQEKLTQAHVPIVALTAHALESDRQQCLDVGMDAYLAKPVRVHELVQTINGFFAEMSAYSTSPAVEETANPTESVSTEANLLADQAPADSVLEPRDTEALPPAEAHQADQPAAAPREEMPSELLYDLELALAATGGDLELVKELVAVFLQENEHDLQSLQAAVLEKDAKQVRAASHKLKNSFGTLGARSAYELASRMEHFARQQDLTDIDTHWQELSNIVARLRPQYQALLRE